MSSAILALPVLVPLFAAVLSMPLTGRPRAQRAIALGAGAILLATAALITAATARGSVLVLPLGGWAPRIGITWVADALTAIVLLTSAVVACAASAYAPASLRGPREARYFYPLQQLMMAGVNGSVVTGDVFNLFVFFEIMLLSSFALIALGARPRGLRAVVAYVAVNLVASAIFLAGVGAIYGAIGTVNLAELSLRARGDGPPGVFWAAAALCLVVFMLKAALVPLFFWLPDAYPEASAVVNALFAGLLAEVGVYALFRTVPLVGAALPAAARSALVTIAAATMLVGVVGALGRATICGVLSFHIVSQVGYMIFGLALLSPLAIAAGIFHTIHNMLAKTALILAGGIAEDIGGSGTIGHVRGIARSHPWVAAGFFVPALSLAGLPPLSGFWGKLFLVAEGFRAGAHFATAIALVVSLLTLASMLKIHSGAFWGDVAGQRAPEAGRDRGAIGAKLALGALTVILGLSAGPVFAHLERAAAALLDTTPYVNAVLGGRR